MKLRAKNTFFKIWVFGYAKNTGKKVKNRETSLAVHFPNTPEGRWERLFWRFYRRTTRKGYLQKKLGKSQYTPKG